MELTVVLMLLAFLGMMVVPIFRTSFSGARQEHSMRDLFAVLKSAQSGAVTEAAEYRVYFEPAKNRYWTEHAVFSEDGIGFEVLAGRSGDFFELPRGLEMEKPKARPGSDEGTYYLAFYPSGACDVASVTVAFAGDRLRRYTFATTGTTVEFEGPQS